MELNKSNWGDGSCANGPAAYCPTVDFNLCYTNDEVSSHRLQRTLSDDITSWQLPVISEDQGGLSDDTGWGGTYLRPVSPASVQVTAQWTLPDSFKFQRATSAPQTGLNTPSNTQIAIDAWSTPPPPPSTLPQQPPPSSSSWVLSSSIALLQQIADSTTVVSNAGTVADPSTRGSRVFTATQARADVSDPACIHTSPAVPCVPGPPDSSFTGAARLEAPGSEEMPCIHEETCVMTETFAAEDSRPRSIVDNWPRDISKPAVVFPNHNPTSSVDMYIEVDSQSAGAESINPGKAAKTSEAISKKSYFLRREDKDREVAPSETASTGQISRPGIESEETHEREVPEPVQNEGQVDKPTKRRYEKCHGRIRKDSPERKRFARTPPPITRTPHPAAPEIPGAVPGPVRPALPSAIKAIPLQVQPLDSRPLSPISHLKIPDPALPISSVSTSKPKDSRVPSTTHKSGYSSALWAQTVTDVPIRPVPITGSLRPCMASTHPRYLPLPPVQFPPQPLLPIPLPPLAALTGAPVTFLHPGFPVVSGHPNQTCPPFTTVGLPHHAGLSAVTVPIFKRPQLLPKLAPVGPDPGALRQRYGAPVAPPTRRQARRRRSSSDSQPAEDGPEAHQARRKQANARERERVNHLNAGFEHLRRALPWMHHGRRVSKVDTLRAAIDYINHLQRLLWEADTASYLSETRSIGSNFPTNDMCKYVHPHQHYPQFGYLRTNFTFADSISRTAAETGSRLELGPPPAKEYFS
ncbi:actin cytoskeleton-regulatory complex protein PAN1-like isoform X2 [Acanthaster planci]|uniref:Actin cytoskeleton-regulatory complex protein PAN1-like isoform X2 n=1 Tax=Acanthaster planci TaxID=133434 RepID=A0A8B8A383_ACAPL|nr:actin cytoskeleton-regulatory complex protein PAN1-like isoform X2 [Acanthaster planci]